MNGGSRLHFSPLVITLLYAVSGSLWIFVGDRLVAGLPDAPLLQTMKGWLFVLFSSMLLYVLIKRSNEEVRSATSRLDTLLTHTSVLHRILRHDIRNACTSILGYSELLEPRTNVPDDVNPIETIQNRASQLVEVSDEVSLLREIEVVEGTAVDIDLARSARDAAEDLRLEYENAHLSVETPPSLVVHGHPALPRSLTELLENAVIHAESETPSIELTVERIKDTAQITVSDDGPGIPLVDQNALQAGTETPLRHTSGIGLWLVRAIVEASNGSLSVLCPDSRGTVVSISVPLATENDSRRRFFTRRTRRLSD
ncbi:sensor histidine kinase [Haloferax sp. DFSO60]|uniref:sensor histidine kinase n=1 Tax=Haloferax sp. DFSO60 TaxID=3388652 RepID=UPI00397A3B3F